MSIQTGPKRILLETLSANTLNINAGVISILGLPSFATAAVQAGGCSRTCPEACTPQVTTITPVVPTTPCECPWLYELKIVRNQCLKTFRTHEAYPGTEPYNVQFFDSGAITVNAIVTSLLNQINANPDSTVIAAGVGTPGSYTALRLTEKDCDSENATCGFTAHVTTGTVVTGTAHVDAKLSATEVARNWPILPGSMFTRPQLAICGNYCVYTLKVNPINVLNDPHLADASVERYLELEIWVNSADPLFYTEWDTPLATELPCLGDALVP